MPSGTDRSRVAVRESCGSRDRRRHPNPKLGPVGKLAKIRRGVDSLFPRDEEVDRCNAGRDAEPTLHSATLLVRAVQFNRVELYRDAFSASDSVRSGR